MRNRMMLVEEILSQLSKKEREKVEKLMKRGTFSLGKNDVDWKKFQIYKSSVNRMKILLADVSFILAVCDSVDESQTVKIAVMLTEEESSVSCLKTSENEILAMIAVNRRQYRILSRGIKMQ